MVITARGAVSVPWQLLFSVVPLLNFVAFYRIKSLQNAVLYIYVPVIAVSIIKGVVFPVHDPELLAQNAELLLYVDYMVGAVILAWTLLMMHRWVKKWNAGYGGHRGL